MALVKFECVICPQVAQCSWREVKVQELAMLGQKMFRVWTLNIPDSMWTAYALNIPDSWWTAHALNTEDIRVQTENEQPNSTHPEHYRHWTLCWDWTLQTLNITDTPHYISQHSTSLFCTTPLYFTSNTISHHHISSHHSTYHSPHHTIASHSMPCDHITPVTHHSTFCIIPPHYMPHCISHHTTPHHHIWHCTTTSDITQLHITQDMH